MTSSPHGPYGLGYTRATMAVTVGRNGATRSQSTKSRLSSDCTLQLECMKLESLVIAAVATLKAKFLGKVQHRG